MLPYRIYLLTCWQDNEIAPEMGVWRFRLEEPRTGENNGFDSLETLLTFLETELAELGSDQRKGE